MKKGLLITLGVILLIVISSVGYVVSSYNRFQQLDETANNNWAQIQNQLQRRSDLIPNFVNTVKGYATHEKDIFLGVADARAKLAGAVKSGDVKATSQANSDLNSAISRLLVVV